MKVIIAKDYEEMSKKAFEVMAEVVKTNPRAVLGLATGSTPLGLYKNMIEDHEKNGTSYRQIHTVNLDEYAGLDVSSDQSYVYFMRRNLFDHLDIDLENTNIENGKAADRQAECERYNKLLEKTQQDIQVLGIGSNGHIAFNDPPVADFDDPALVKPVALDEICRNQQVHDGCFATLDDVPTHALTLTVPALMHAAQVFCVVPAATKARAVRDTLLGDIRTACPASILRRHPAATLYLDADSASLL